MVSATAPIRQVITVSPSGEISGLQVKPGRGIDLRRFGPAKIVRASEIVWDEEAQGWAVVIQDAPGLEVLKGVALTNKMADRFAVTQALVLSMVADGKMVLPPATEGKPLLFNDYDDAVTFEIAYLDAWRLDGVFRPGDLEARQSVT